MHIYCNGGLVQKEAMEELFEPGFLFGWGTFEPLRAYAGRFPLLDEHIGRLNQSLELLSLEKVSLAWEETLKDLLSANSFSDAYVRISAYKKRSGTGVIIYADTFGYYGPQDYEKGFSALPSPHRRSSHEVASKVKSLSYLQNRLSWLIAQKANKDEALIMSETGDLVGGSRSNIFLLKNHSLLTPSLTSGAFPGITRDCVIAIARGLDIQVIEKPCKPEAIACADEAFVTSALMEVMPLVEYEGKPIASGKPGAVTGKIHSEYRKLTLTPNPQTLIPKS